MYTYTMTQFVVYRKPEVDDQHYDEYPWKPDSSTYETRAEAQKEMPNIGSEIGKGYVFRIFEFKDTKEIPSSISVSDVHKYS